MKSLRTLAVIAVCFSLSLGARAQEVKTANFLDNYLYGYRLNPSLTPSGTAGFIGLATGSVALDADTNFGLSNFLFPQADGSLVTGFNKAVPESVFPGGLEKMNRLDAHASWNVLAIGSSGKKGRYGHFEINFVSDNSLGIPRSLFEALKSNNTTGNYQVKDLNFHTTNYLELAFGRSKRNRNLAIGWAIKGLVGIAKMDATIDMEINTAGDKMYVSSQGSMRASIPAVRIGTDGDGYYDFSKLTLNTENLMPTGFGAAIDFGASYYLWKDRIILGAAVRNLGRMKWTPNIFGQNSGAKVYVDMDNPDNMTDGLKEMTKFKPIYVNEVGKIEKLPYSYNLSARLKPFKFLTLGIVSTVNHYDGYVNKDVRLGAAFTPFRQFNVAGSYSIGNVGNEIGVAASVRFLGITAFAGVDAIQYKVTPQYIPVDPLNVKLSTGVAFAFGQSKAKAAQAKAASKKSVSPAAGNEASPLVQPEEMVLE